jgi:hypothetical protein
LLTPFARRHYYRWCVVFVRRQGTAGVVIEPYGAQ